MNSILSLIGWFAIAAIYGLWLASFSLIFFNNIGRWNIGGAPNSVLKRIFVFTIGIFNIFIGIQIAKIAPFTITL